MQRIVIVALAVAVCVLGYSTYHYASAQGSSPTTSRAVTAKTAAVLADTTDELYPYETAYQARAIRNYEAELRRNPQWGAIFSDSVQQDIANYEQDKGAKFALRSVWVDDTTILHFAYCILRNKDNDTAADGLRLVLEEYRYGMTLPSGTPCQKGDVNIALVATRTLNGKHVNWYSDKIFKTLKPDVTSNNAPSYDNFNDPCPPSTTNCSN